MEAKNKSTLARDLGVSRSLLYYKHKQEDKDWATKVMIEEALRENHSYGHKRLATHLKINKKRVRRVMSKYGIRPYKRRGKKWRRSKATGVDYPNLLLTNTPSYPGHIWASDFTYLWYKGAWLYVATVIDLYGREIVGLATSRHHDRWLVTQALLDALRYHAKPAIIHSDHGSEYKSKDYQALLTELGIKPSMAAKGCPWENGYQESFYSQFKVDLGDPARFGSLGELSAAIYRQIWYYNNQRIHTALKMSPLEFINKEKSAIISYKESV
jgi:putative transposase